MQEPDSGFDSAAWDRQQVEIRSKVITTDTFTWRVEAGVSQDKLRLVGGLDISFRVDQSERERAVACLVVLSLPTLEVVHEATLNLVMPHSYRPGYLAARECPAYMQLLTAVKATPFCPQVVLVDGFGILHPRGCGSASHVGVLADIPTIGVGKNLLHVDGLTEQHVRCCMRAAGEGTRIPAAAGDAMLPTCHPNGSITMPLVGLSGATLGMALTANAGVQKPVYVSIGHGISLSTAMEVVRCCCLHRVPEPIRQADIRSRQHLRELLDAGV
ncbi:hypothetical protein WJX72_003894 [[Myrmecia] bisecta]|uniref:Endonuclease V n=1 Tax=[Myrmecia] bisecta TaxID=41462 RepID=A0AAW1PS36_9CHLO